MAWPALVPARAAPDGSRRVGVDARGEASADRTAVRPLIDALKAMTLPEAVAFVAARHGLDITPSYDAPPPCRRHRGPARIPDWDDLWALVAPETEEPCPSNAPS